jgi:hypothetical protein
MTHPFNVEATQLDILATGSRAAVIDWLTWNDSNGIYSDADCISEGYPVLTLRVAVGLMADVLSACNPQLDYLTTEYTRFFPTMGSADEVLYAGGLSDEDASYLAAFVIRWELTEAAAS